MKGHIPKEQEQKLVIDELSFTYEEPIADLADWYDEEATIATNPETETEATLNDISFAARSGELILITGESGCGKTTLLQIINGIIPEFSGGRIEGDVLFRGTSFWVCRLTAAGTDRFGFSNPRSQFFNVLVKDELRFGCENFNLPVEVIENAWELWSKNLI